MKLTTFFTPLSLLTVLSPLPVLADGDSIIQALKTVEASTTKLGTSVSSWKGDLLGKIPILTNGISLLTTVNKATKTAEKSAALDFDATISVAVATIELGNAVNITLTALIDAKPKFDKRLLSPVILINLGLQRKATNELSEAIVAKVPVELQAIARDLVKPVDEGFEKTIDAFHHF